MSQSLMTAYKHVAAAPLGEARCLPFAVYHDRSVFAAEAESLFHNDWVFACAEAKLAKQGDYFALDIAGEQVVVIRGKDGELRALSNNCRHRGTPLLELGFGEAGKNIVCPYHAWTFDDKGAFRGAPFAGEVAIEKDEHCLPQYAVAVWRGLVFVNLADQPQPFSERVAGVDAYLDVYELERFKYGYHLDAEYWNANWKLAVENGIESYHLFKVHKETLETMTPTKQAYYVAGSSEWTLTGGAIKDQRSTLSKWLIGNNPEVYSQYLLLFFPPSLIAVADYEGIHWIQVLPIDAEHCQVIPGGLTDREVKRFDTPEFKFVNAFLAEDKEICERVQRGMYSKKAEGGKLVSLEKILVDFRHYLGNRMFGTTPEPFTEGDQAEMFLQN